MIYGVEKPLEDTLSEETFDLVVKNRSKTVSGMAIRISDPPDPEDMTANEEPEFLFIPEDRICGMPTRDNSPGSIFANLVGTPIEIPLKEKGILTGKKSVLEFQCRIYQTTLKKICPALEQGLKSGKLTKVEYNYVHNCISISNAHVSGGKKGICGLQS